MNRQQARRDVDVTQPRTYKMAAMYILPRAAVNFHSHADSSTVMAVWEEAELAGDQHRIQFALLGHVGVGVAGHNLQIKGMRQVSPNRW